MAEYYLDHNENNKVPEIFGGKFDLTLIHPTVDVFHVSEVRTFFSIVGIYFARMNNLVRALYHYSILTDIDPDHPATKKVGDEIILKEIDNVGKTFFKRTSRRKKK
jgi:hypothetical protein